MDGLRNGDGSFVLDTHNLNIFMFIIVELVTYSCYLIEFLKYNFFGYPFLLLYLEKEIVR